MHMCQQTAIKQLEYFTLLQNLMHVHGSAMFHVMVMSLISYCALIGLFIIQIYLNYSLRLFMIHEVSTIFHPANCPFINTNPNHSRNPIPVSVPKHRARFAGWKLL